MSSHTPPTPVLPETSAHPLDVAVDPAARTVYVVNYHSVLAIDTETRPLSDTVELPSDGTGSAIAVDTSGTTAHIAHGSGISVISR